MKPPKSRGDAGSPSAVGARTLVPEWAPFKELTLMSAAGFPPLAGLPGVCPPADKNAPFTDLVGSVKFAAVVGVPVVYAFTDNGVMPEIFSKSTRVAPVRNV